MGGNCIIMHNYVKVTARKRKVTRGNQRKGLGTGRKGSWEFGQRELGKKGSGIGWSKLVGKRTKVEGMRIKSLEKNRMGTL